MTEATNTERTQQLARLHVRQARLEWEIQCAHTTDDVERLRRERQATIAERERVVAEMNEEAQS